MHCFKGSPSPGAVLPRSFPRLPPACIPPHKSSPTHWRPDKLCRGVDAVTSGRSGPPFTLPALQEKPLIALASVPSIPQSRAGWAQSTPAGTRQGRLPRTVPSRRQRRGPTQRGPYPHRTFRRLGARQAPVPAPLRRFRRSLRAQSPPAADSHRGPAAPPPVSPAWAWVCAALALGPAATLLGGHAVAEGPCPPCPQGRCGELARAPGPASPGCPPRPDTRRQGSRCSNSTPGSVQRPQHPRKTTLAQAPTMAPSFQRC